MYRIYTKQPGTPSWHIHKFPLIMRLTTVLIIVSMMQVSAATTYAQRITLKENNVMLEKVFQEIRKQSGYDFVFDRKLLQKANPVNLDLKRASLEEVLSICFSNQPFTYIIEEKSVIVKEKEKSIMDNLIRYLSYATLTGTVLNEKGQPIPGATVSVKGTKMVLVTNSSGIFTLKDLKEKTVLVISYVGYKSKEVEVKPDQKQLSIQLEIEEKVMDDVVITGMFTRKKESFTGAVASFTGKELKQLGNLNVLESLKTLDPSFIMVKNNQLGSNPNQLPNIEIRGKTSITSNSINSQFSGDPNQPLFILNGMESTLSQIVDLDMNQVASITLLKDAASTALYGSKASNGVVVIETVRPKPGETRISYTEDFRFELPDLSDYNMMNAEENLRFQKLAGLYSANGETMVSPLINDNLYNNRLIDVKRGVNSYWLNTPLRNGVTDGHSIQVSGGSEEFQYGVNLNYRTLNGVMKGSDRDTWGGSINLAYRKKKLNITNVTYISGTNANESPYGSFSQYVDINPYYQKKKSDGSLNTDKYLEQFYLNSVGSGVDTLRIPNPLYNASLEAKNSNKSTTIQNNLNLIWDLAADWRLSGGLQVEKDITTAEQFTPSANTMFDAIEINEKGSYGYSQMNGSGYQGNVMLTYNRVFNGVHSLTGNIRGGIQEQNQEATGYTAVGFPEGVPPNPAFSYGFTPSSKPSYSYLKTRSVNALGSFNYAYDNRYYADLTYRIDGSTLFGTANKYSPFWSAGLGWTINHEKFLRDVGWITTLRVRGNIGTSGNQSLGAFTSSSVLGYENNINSFGQGLYLISLGNPNLEWQNTREISLGTDAAFFGNRLTATFNAYRKTTTPLITEGSVPSSAGISSYPLNVGSMETNGIEAILHFSPVYKPDKNVIWTLGFTGDMYKSLYHGFSNVLKTMNEQAQESNSLQRYLDDNSPDELWAVRSAGIDPSSGKEVYIRKNGEKTFVYNPDDEVAIGNGRPTIEGILSSNLYIKGFSLGINLRYSIGAYLLNSALFDKVENINFADLNNNQDKRALNLRWQKPGDVAEFKAIDLFTSTPMSSRFIEKENYLSGESINVGYEFQKASFAWVRALKLQTVRINGYMNDAFRLSNIQSERGIDYPFSRAFSFSINLFF